MKRLLSFFLAIMLAVVSYGQGMVIPGKGKIQVEDLKDNLNLNMDLSHLSVCELRILRNALAARQGYVFKASDLRSVFMSTSWYYELAVKRNEGRLPAIKYTAAETEFINRVQAREAQLLARNYSPAGGGIVSVENIVNPYLLERIDPRLTNVLNKNGFAVVASDDEQLFQIYESNMYGQMPSFITTDLFLQLYHMYFDTTLRKVEESTLLEAMTDYCQYMYNLMDRCAGTYSNAELRDAAQWNKAYFAIAKSLFSGEKAQSVAAEYASAVKDEIESVYNENDNFSEYLGYTSVMFGYSLFRPRGHYTRSEAVKRYFRGMMWLQTVPFGSDNREQVLRAAVIAEATHGDRKAMSLYEGVDKPVRFLIGEPDNLTIMQFYDIMSSLNATAEIIAEKKSVLKKLQKNLDDLGEKQIRIRPPFERTSRTKINIMPQRYTPDAEVLLNTVDYESEVSRRDLPKGLDFMAAIGVSPAENILFNELKEAQQWAPLTEKLSKMTSRMNEIDWDATVYNRWEDALRTLCVAKDSNYPYFMNTPQWDKKNLNAALASWAELKHDAILYAKQPFAAECGGDEELPFPVTKAYVEPNVAFWTKAISLIDETVKVLGNSKLLTPEINKTAQLIRDEADFLLQVSRKELAGQTVTDEEYERMRYIGAKYEKITLDLIGSEDYAMLGWYQVEGADKSVAVVADVYTNNGDNCEEKSILYEGVGPADEIYVIVEIDGQLYLTRGAVFSYREFKRPLSMPRLTDEEWQQMLPESPDMGRPSWMNEIIVPLKEKPEINGEVFYGGGC